ncbi:MAG: polyamine ABC transporter substrate-binding protein [Rhodospirillales bacterium]|nr:polyamine ABC transporter substrate-binding protein [Rhodospirillales bacterium]
MRRRFALNAILACLVALLISTAVAAQPVLHVYNWSDYIDKTIIEDFEKTSGIKVVYDVYDSNDILETKLLAGKSGYDLVFPSGNFLARQIKADVFQPLDRTRLTNWDNLDPAMMRRLTVYDPDNRFGVPYLWGTTGIAYNPDKISERMKDAPIQSWQLIYDPEILRRFKDCGIFLLDAGDEIIPATLHHLGLDPDSKDPKVIEQAKPPLMAIRPLIRKFHSSENINALANGDICLAVMWSGDAKQAGMRAKEANNGITVKYAIPKEGAQMWIDMMAIPADAPNPDAAHQFINYLLQPEVIAKATNFVGYPNPIPASKPMVNGALINDPNVYPPDEVMERLFLVTPYDQKTQRVVTRLWQSVKAGN